MLRRNRWSILAAVLVVLAAAPARAQLTDDEVRRAIDRGVEYLKKNQKADGSWSDHPGYPGGLTALCTLALLNAGVDSSKPEIQKSLNYLRSLGEPQMVYSTSLITMVLCAAEPDRDAALIRNNVNWLERIQLRSGRTGSWAYSDRSGSGDNSNAQFALLALHEAERVGVKVSPTTWELAREYWEGCQNDDGSWGYFRGEPPTGSMTCAGIASLVIAGGKVSRSDAQVVDGMVKCCGTQEPDEPLERGLQWLGAKFSAEKNPNPFGVVSSHFDKAWLYYYLYGVERVGRLTGRRFLGSHDWFREGAGFLVDQQDPLQGLWRGETFAEQNPLIATSFSLLFLSKGRRPVVISKLKHGSTADWDHHRDAVQKLTRRIEQRWKRDLTWQTIDARAATVEDLLETPVLWISGRDALDLSADQRSQLREFILQGGFIFAEACCGGEAFDRGFRALMRELFPDSPLRLLPPDHPVWFAEQRVDPEYMRPLYGMDACCRTSVVYCPDDLSCYWELSRGERDAGYTAAVAAEVEACLRIGENVVTYATNRELKNKLDRGNFVLNRAAPHEPERAVLYVPKLLYAGGGDDAPNTLPNLLNFVRDETGMRVGVENRLVQATDTTIFDYPLLFLHGRRAFRFTPAERQALATYVQRGGTIFADAICGSPEFAESFRRELQAIFPDQPLNRIPPGHPLFSREYRGFELDRVTLRDPQQRTAEVGLKANLKQVSPLLEAVETDGRLAVIFSPYDISCALESGSSLECHGYLKPDAAKIGMNVVLFALQQ